MQEEEDEEKGQSPPPTKQASMMIKIFLTTIRALFRLSLCRTEAEVYRAEGESRPEQHVETGPPPVTVTLETWAPCAT